VLRTAAIVAVWQAAATPVRFGDLIDKLAADVTADRRKVRDAITALLVRPGFLPTRLRVPVTITDPLSHLPARLHDVDAADLSEIADLLRDLDAVHADAMPEIAVSEDSGRRVFSVPRARGLGSDHALRYGDHELSRRTVER
jgi:hypothetical protein